MQISRWGVDLARPGGCATALAPCKLINGEIGVISGFRFIESPVLLHFPDRLGARRRARSARGRKAALHAAGMRRRQRLWVSPILRRFVASLKPIARCTRASPDSADALAYGLAANPFRNFAAETSGMANPPEFRRASGGCVCAACGKEYRRHPHSEHRDFNDDPFLNVLCNGDLVKL